MSPGWLLGLGAALAMPGPDPSQVEVLRLAGTWQWYAVPLDRVLARGERVLVGPCGDRTAGGVDPATLRGLAVTEEEALALLHAQADAATLLCLDPALLGLQRSCPGDLPDPARSAVEALAVEQALLRWGSAAVARAVGSLHGSGGCGASFRAVVVPALEAGAGVGPEPEGPPLPRGEAGARSASSAPATPLSSPPPPTLVAPAAEAPAAEVPPAVTLSRIAQERGVDESGMRARRRAATSLEHLLVERLEAPSIRRMPDPDLRDALLRLADAWGAEGSARMVVEGHAHEFAQAACAEAPPCDPAAVPADHAASRIPRLRQVETLDLFQAVFPDDPARGDVLAMLSAALEEEASALSAEGRDAEARRVRGRSMAAAHLLLRDHPTHASAHKIAARLGLVGWRQSGDLPSTRLALLRSMSYPPSDHGLHAAVELARIARSQQQPRQGLEWLRGAVQRARDSAELGPRLAGVEGAAALKEEYEQMVGCWGDLGAIDEAWAAVEAEVPDPDLQFRLLRGLARWQPAEEGAPAARFDDRVLAVHERLVAGWPEHGEAPLVLVDEAVLLRDLARYDEAASVIGRAIDAVQPGSAWTQAQPVPAPGEEGAVARARAAVENEARSFVEKLDALSADPQASRGERRRFGALAIDILDRYVAVFPDTVQAPDAMLELADRLSDREDHARAWQLYRDAGRQLGARPGEQARSWQATRLSFLAAEGWVATELRAHPRPPRAPGLRVELLPAEEALVEAAAALLATGWNPPEGPGWMLRVGEQLLEVGDHEAARTWLLRLLNAPSEPAAREAGILALDDSFAERGDWAAALRTWAEVEPLARDVGPGVARAWTQAHARARVEDARRQLAAGTMEASEAADRALAQAAALPAGELQTATLRLGATWLRQAGRIAEEIAVRHRLVFELEGEGALAEEGRLAQLVELAVAHEGSMDWERAAATWESVARRTADPAVALEALASARSLRQGLGQHAAAARDLRLVLDDPRQPDLVRLSAARELRALLDVAGLQEGQRARWLDLLELEGDAPGLLGIRMLAAAALWDLDRGRGGADPGRLERAWGEWSAWRVGVDSVPDDLVLVASELALARLELRAREISRVSLVLGINRNLARARFDAAMAARLAEKAERVTACEQVLAELGALKVGPHVVQGLVLWGDVQQGLAVALETSVRPSYLTDEQVPLYVQGLHDQSFLKWQAAWQAYGLAIEAAAQASAAGSWAWGEATTRARVQRRYLAEKLGEIAPEEDLPAEWIPAVPDRPWATSAPMARALPDGVPEGWVPPPNRPSRRRRVR